MLIKLGDFGVILFAGRFVGGCVKWLLLVPLSAYIAFNLSACTPKNPQEPSTMPDLKAVAENPLTPEEAEEMLGEVGDNWLYGQGLGETALSVGTVVVFPPYALWLATNGVLELSGYEPLRFSDALTEEDREDWTETYDTVTAAPGRLSAAVAGKEFRSKEVAQERLSKYFPRKEVERSAEEKTAKPASDIPVSKRPFSRAE